MLESGRLRLTPPPREPPSRERYCEATGMPATTRPLFLLLRWLLAAAVVLVLCLLRWGDNLLIVSEPIPGRAQVGIVLQGSIAAEKVRIARAIDLLRQ